MINTNIITNRQRNANTVLQNTTLESCNPELNKVFSTNSLRIVKGVANPTGGYLTNEYDNSIISLNSNDIVLAITIANGNVSGLYQGSDVDNFPEPFTSGEIQLYLINEDNTKSQVLSDTFDLTNLGAALPSPPIAGQIPVLWNQTIGSSNNSNTTCFSGNCNRIIVDGYNINMQNPVIKITLLVLNTL